MEVEEALYTTRAMRRVRSEPIPMEVQARILDAAIRAPSGGNSQNWRFLLVDDGDVIARIAPLYRDGLDQLWKTFYADQIATAAADAGHRREQEHAGRPAIGPVAGRPLRGGAALPLRVCPGRSDRELDLPGRVECAAGCPRPGSGQRPDGAPELPAPGRGLEILGIPSDGQWLMACCVSFGYPTGRWGVAPRRPVHEVSFRNRWGEPVGFDVPAPLWPGSSEAAV